EEDPALVGNPSLLGPNPKIRNTSRGYGAAKGDLLWALDCNVWVGKGVLGRMVDKLCGMAADGGQARKYKFVHHLPLVVDVAEKHLSQDYPQARKTTAAEFSVLRGGGGRLEELFMSSSHAKFYTAINTVLVAPCIVGKSNMYRRSHLNHLTAGRSRRRPGIDCFSDNICEDHLIGDLLWKQRVPEEAAGERWGKHALVFGDLAVQPMAGTSVQDYIARRVRWLRVRKFTVTLATLVEPGTESFLCSLYGAYGVTSLPWCYDRFGIPPTWGSFMVFWVCSVAIWSMVDLTVYLKLHSAATIEPDQHESEDANGHEDDEEGDDGEEEQGEEEQDQEQDASQPPPLPAEGPPSTNARDDGWQPVWDASAGAFYFYNSISGETTWTNPRVPDAPTITTAATTSLQPPSGLGGHDRMEDGSPLPSSLSAAAPPRPYGGYDPSIHGDYDPTAPYAQEAASSHIPPSTSLSLSAPPPGGTAEQSEAYGATGTFNRFTGKWQAEGLGPELHNDENKTRRQMSAFFDVDAAANSHDGRSLKAERAGKRLSKKELKAFKEKRREKKEEKRRAWLRD
ncbi:MAG: hypothetical protein M1838_004604, partial [Thelocarpon superellum]